MLTPFTLAGAMAPVTVAGAVTQQNAEALAGLALTQVVRPGAPFVYGGFTSNVDMKSGAPAFGTPEYMKACLLGGQLARRYGLPYRSSNANAANTLDAQAAYESVFSLWGAIMGGVNLLMHGAGWMEGGLHASFEKMVLDADLLDMVEAFLRPVKVDAEELALDAMREVGPAATSSARAHAGALPHRVLRADDLRLAQLRDLARGRLARPPTTPPTVSTSSGSPPTSRRRWTRPSARNSKPSSPAARPRAACRRITEGDGPRGRALSRLWPDLAGRRTTRTDDRVGRAARRAARTPRAGQASKAFAAVDRVQQVAVEMSARRSRRTCDGADSQNRRRSTTEALHRSGTSDEWRPARRRTS